MNLSVISTDFLHFDIAIAANAQECSGRVALIDGHWTLTYGTDEKVIKLGRAHIVNWSEAIERGLAVLFSTLDVDILMHGRIP